MIRSANLILIFFSFYSILGLSQDSIPAAKQLSESEMIIAKITEYEGLASSDPEKATKRLLEVKEKCEKIDYKVGAMRSSRVLVLLYYNDGNYEKALEELRFFEKYAIELEHNEYLSDIHRLRSNVYGEMGLINESFQELEKSLPYVDKIKSPIKNPYKKALIYESYAGLYTKKGDGKKEIYYRQKSIEQSNRMPESRQAVINAKYQNLAYQYAGIALVYNTLNINDSADYYFHKALKIHENEKYNIYVNGRAVLLSEMAKFYSDNGEHSKAIEYGKRAEGFEKQAPMAYIRKSIYHSLFNSYIETAKKDSSKYYLKLYTALNDSLLSAEKASIMTPVKQIISDNETENKVLVRNIITISAVLLIVLIFGGWLYWTRKNKILHKKYKKLIAKIKSEKVQLHSNLELENVDSVEDKTVAKITDDTTKALLQKLVKFESSGRYLRKNINLTWLSNDFGTNPRYLSAIIKDHRKKTFANYINGLKISYIIHKLVEDPMYREYKINYLSEECGYASSQVFVIAFKKETGFTPSYFIDKIKKDSQEEIATL